LNNRMKHTCKAAIIGLIFLALDYLSKWWVVFELNLQEKLYMHVSPILHFVMAWNKGVNFGIFANDNSFMKIGLSLFAVIVSIGLLIWIYRQEDAKFAARLTLPAGLIIGGALGNAYDRIVYGAVADFLNISCCGINNPYAFNLADVFIFVGVGLIFWQTSKNDKAKLN